MTMLSAPLDLVFPATGETVTDVEQLCRGVMGEEGWPKNLPACDNDELLAWLLGEAVVLTRVYCARDGIEARPFLFQRLRWRSRDWRDRVWISDDERRDLVSFVEPDGDELDDEAGASSRRALNAGAHGSPGEVAGDRGDPGRDALRELLEGGDRALLREIEALGLGPPPGARGRSSLARRRLNRLERQRLDRVAAADRLTVEHVEVAA